MSTVTSNLTKIESIKEQIYSVIKNKGVDIANDIPFEEYPNEIGKISGGSGSINTTELTVQNTSGTNVASGQTCMLSRIATESGDNKFIVNNSNYSSYNAAIMSEFGDKLFGTNYSVNGVIQLYWTIEDLNGVDISKPCRYEGTVNDLKEITWGPNWELITRSSLFQGEFSWTSDNTSARVDTTKITFNMFNGNPTLYIGEDIFIERRYGSNDQYWFNKINLSSGVIEKKFSCTDYLPKHYKFVARKEGNNLYLYDFNKNIRYLLDVSVEDNTNIKDLPQDSLTTNFNSNIEFYCNSFTDDGNFLLLGNNYYSFGIMRRINDTTFKLLDVDEYPPILKAYIQTAGSNNFVFNSHNGVLSKTNIDAITSRDISLRCLKYSGISQTGDPIFVDIKLQIPEDYDITNKYFRGPITFDKNVTKCCIPLGTSGNYPALDICLMYVNTESDFKIVTPSQYNFNDQSLSCVAEEDIISGNTGNVLVYELKTSTATITSNANNAEIKIIGGAE